LKSFKRKERPHVHYRTLGSVAFAISVSVTTETGARVPLFSSCRSRLEEEVSKPGLKMLFE
jgi:hypothetical protein